MQGINICKKIGKITSRLERKNSPVRLDTVLITVFMFPAGWTGGGPGGQAGPPVFTKLSGGRHRDHNQSVAKQTKPIRARRSRPPQRRG